MNKAELVKKLENQRSAELSNGEYLHCWFSNNRGRGSDNCTIIKSGSPERATTSKKQSDVMVLITTSAWKGKINLSKIVLDRLI